MPLSRGQRNELVSILTSKGLRPADFEIKDGTYSFDIQSPEKNVSFDIIYVEGSFFKPRSSPDGFINKRFLEVYYWKDVLDGFNKWAQFVADELQTPDLWAQAKTGTSFLTNDSTIPNERFSLLEIRSLEDKLPIVEERIAAIDISNDAKSAFTEIAREVPKDAGILSKKKLGELLTGQLISQGLKWALTTEHMHALWEAFKAFTQLFLH